MTEIVSYNILGIRVTAEVVSENVLSDTLWRA